MRTKWTPRLFLGLRFRLILLVVVAIIPALGLIAYTSLEQQRLSAVQARENALKIARSSASSHEQLLEGARQLLAALSQLDPVQTKDQAICSSVFGTLLSQYSSYANLGVIDADGTVFCSALPLGSTSINVADRSYYRRTLKTQAFIVGEYQNSRLTGDPVLTLAYPVFNQNKEITSIVFAGLDLTWLNAQTSQQHLPDGARLTIIDRQGTVLVQVPGPASMIGQQMPVTEVRKAMLARGEGWIEHVQGDENSYLYAFTRIKSASGTEMYIAIALPEEVAFAELGRIASRNWIALSLVAVLALAAGRVVGDSFILRRVDALVIATRRLTAGDLSARSGLSFEGGELNDLARAFDQMAETLQKQEVERAQMDQALLASARRSEALAGAARRLNARLQVEDVLHTVCEEATRALNADAARLCLYDPACNLLMPAADYGFSAERSEHWCPIPRATFDELAQRLGLPVVIADIDQLSDLLDLKPYTELGVRSVASAWLLRDDELAGVLSVFSVGAPRRFTRDELMLLEGLSDQAAQAITNANLYEALKREEQARATLLHQTISAQEDERIRIARELHDETSQGLSAVMLGLDTLRLALATHPETVSERLENTRHIASSLLDNIRRLIADLRPSLLDQLGLVPAVTWYGEQRLNPLGIAMHLEENLDGRLPPEVETCLFRIVQEGLTNVIRHAQATEVDIRLMCENGRVTLRMADNGAGFSQQTLMPREEHDRGWGLRGIQERVSLLRGEFALYTSPGQGVVICVTLPIAARREDMGHDQSASG